MTGFSTIRIDGARVLAVLHGLELFGHERGNIEVFKALREMGAIVRVGVSSRENGGQVAEELRSLEFDTFPVPFGPQWSWQWVKNEGLGFAVAQFARLFRCSRVFHHQIRVFQPTHIHLGSPLAYSFLSLALMWSKLPLIWRMGDCPPIDSRFNLPIWRMGMRRAARVVANSHYVKGSAVSAGVPQAKVSVIYNFARDSHVAAENDQQPPLLHGAEKALIYVGSVAEHKGLLPLVEAFGTVAGDRPGLRLWILGGSAYDGDFRQQLQHRLQELNIERQVLMTGHVGNLVPWYAAASLHLAPSIWEEPAANVVFEAKREGTPSVVFPSGGLPELVRHAVDGYICQEKSSVCLAAAIHWMLADPERLSSMSAAAKSDCETRFGRERFYRQWAEVYESSSSRRRK